MKTSQQIAEGCMEKFNNDTQNLGRQDWENTATILRDFFEAIVMGPNDMEGS